MDVLFVGAGPAGLAGAIELARLVAAGGMGEVNIGVLEKAGALGEHCLSGAVVNPRAFHELFPDLPASAFPFRQRVDKEEIRFMTRTGGFRIPTPPTMRNHGNYAASLSEIVRWLGERAEAAGVNIFTGFPADGLLVNGAQGARRPDHADRPQPRRHAGPRLSGRHRPDRKRHRAHRGHPWGALPGVAPMAASREP
jgi:electron-transferring-flavoprotein dehydrogenase